MSPRDKARLSLLIEREIAMYVEAVRGKTGEAQYAADYAFHSERERWHRRRAFRHHLIVLVLSDMMCRTARYNRHDALRAWHERKADYHVSVWN